MAKASFHKNQKVWVDSVGAWAVVERLIPVWAKGFEEPVRITYDVGLGREFQAHELAGETTGGGSADPGGNWRILRARNKWQALDDCGHHPQPGTFPVVVTDAQDWGGWRVPGAEYDRDPAKIEMQARLLACAPRLLRLAQDLAELVGEAPDEVDPETIRLARAGAALVKVVLEPTAAPSAALRMAAE